MTCYLLYYNFFDQLNEQISYMISKFVDNLDFKHFPSSWLIIEDLINILLCVLVLFGNMIWWTRGMECFCVNLLQNDVYNLYELAIFEYAEFKDKNRKDSCNFWLLTIHYTYI